MYYVYKITNIVNNKIYIGVHKSDSIQSDQYLGSGKILNVAVIKYGRDKFKRDILYEFENKQSAYAMQKLIVDKQFVKRKDTYNIKQGGDGGWYRLNETQNIEHISKGKVVVRDKDGNIFQTDVDDPRYLSGQLVSHIKGKVTVKDSNGITFQVDKSDPRYISGQLVGNQKGFIIAKDPNGIIARVSKDDPRWLSGQLVGVAKGNILQGHQLGDKNSQYGTIWVTNGIQNKKIKKEQNIPQGWRRGRKLK